MAIVRSFFDPDPPPDGMDQVSSEWLMRQFRRVADSLLDFGDEDQDAWTVSPLSSQVSELRQRVKDLEQESGVVSPLEAQVAELRRRVSALEQEIEVLRVQPNWSS